MGDQVDWNTAGADNFLSMINVVEKGIDGLHALLDTTLEAMPFLCRQYAGNQVERMRRSVAFFAVDVKSYPGAPEKPLGFLRFLRSSAGVSPWNHCS